MGVKNNSDEILRGYLNEFVFFFFLRLPYSEENNKAIKNSIFIFKLIINIKKLFK